MSGGHWNYVQTSLEFIVYNDIIDLADHATDPKVKMRLYFAAEIVRKAAYAIKRVDYWVSGDDSDETFVRLWDTPPDF